MPSSKLKQAIGKKNTNTGDLPQRKRKKIVMTLMKLVNLNNNECQHQ